VDASFAHHGFLRDRNGTITTFDAIRATTGVGASRIYRTRVTPASRPSISASRRDRLSGNNARGRGFEQERGSGVL
jgi:hypothetical protein